MSKYLFMDRVIESVSHGKTLNRIVYIILWIFAVLVGLICLISWVTLWRFMAFTRGIGILGA
jgi:high-affinity K+ transport system ATPase subunit B